ncbi:MAG: hypothetical protein KDK97_22485, partial [Verrucomicrobiales bacterium]|nr:hypothetical protein [Verrucomicrobiales bacterium]
ALGGQKDWKADSEEATAVVTDPIGGGQVAKLGGVKGVSAEPVCLWHALPESVEGTGQKVYVSFDANLDLAATGNSKDQFSWSIYNEREEPLLALWMSAEDGSMRVVNASGQAWDLDAKLVAGASQKFAFEVDPVAATWGLSLDGVSMFDGQSLGVDSSEARLGDVSAIWLPGSTEPAALVFDNFSITTELDSASIAADGEAETEAAAQATLIVK